MTIVGGIPAQEERRLGDVVGIPEQVRPDIEPPDLPPEPDDGSRPDDGPQPVAPTTAAAAAFLSSAAAGWLIGGIFAGNLARAVGLLGAFIGAGCYLLSTRTRRSAAVQLAALPIAAGVGALLTLPFSNGGGASLPSLIAQALRSGGLSSPPVPFDPGWRFLVVVLVTVVAVAAASTAVAFRRPRLAVVVPVPILIGGVLLQPAGAELLSVAVGLMLTIAALAVAYGGELARQGVGGRGFEARRLLRAGGVILLIVAALVGVTQLGFLLPPAQQSKIIPPKRPEVPPATSDHLLFTVRMPAAAPLRLGVLDVYGQDAWLTPPYDPARFLPARPGQPLPRPQRPVDNTVVVTPPTGPSVTATFTLSNIGAGRQVPDLANPVELVSGPKGIGFDPRTQTLQLPGAVPPGTTYTVRAAAAPLVSALDGAPAASGPQFAPYRAVPAPPPGVSQLLAQIPAHLSPYERLQFVRTKLFSQAVAAGPGNPVDVPPARVDAILAGRPASPYEITAAEVLLARWAGVPARMGYGYYTTTRSSNGAFPVYAHDGASWLEAYFPGSGWVPILGEPAKAQSSLNRHPQKAQPRVLPNGQLIAQVNVPVKLPGLQLLSSLVQFWLVRVLPPLVGVILLWLLYPGLLKMLRRQRRRRWADRHGPRTRVATAYAELRDQAIDFNIGHPSDTPLEFLDMTIDDTEHTQLAWLVTRALWGDVARGVTADDAEAAELLARSLRRRLAAAQPFIARAVAFGSRASLRDPYSAELPNVWWQLPARAGVPRLRPRLRNRRRPAFASAALVLLVALLLGGCAQQVDLSRSVARPPALPAVPTTLTGYTLKPDDAAATAFAHLPKDALISSGRIYAIRHGTLAVGTLQTSAFKPGLVHASRSQQDQAVAGVLSSLGGGFSAERIGGQQLFAASVGAQREVVYFSPDRTGYQLLIASAALPHPDTLLAAAVVAEHGGNATAVTAGATAYDPRRGTP